MMPAMQRYISQSGKKAHQELLNKILDALDGQKELSHIEDMLKEADEFGSERDDRFYESLLDDVIRSAINLDREDVVKHLLSTRWTNPNTNIESKSRHFELGTKELSYVGHNLSDTLLHIAIKRCNVKIVELILKDPRTTVEVINSADKEGQTPLHLAVEASNEGGKALRIVELLLEHGGDVKIRNNCKRTPFDTAMDKGNEEVAEKMIDKLSADVGQSAARLFVDDSFRTVCGKSPMRQELFLRNPKFSGDIATIGEKKSYALYAAVHKKLAKEKIEKLLKEGASPGSIVPYSVVRTISEYYDGEYIFSHEELLCDPRIVDLLIKFGAKLDKNLTLDYYRFKNNDGLCPSIVVKKLYSEGTYFSGTLANLCRPESVDGLCLYNYSLTTSWPFIKREREPQEETNKRRYEVAREIIVDKIYPILSGIQPGEALTKEQQLAVNHLVYPMIASSYCSSNDASCVGSIVKMIFNYLKLPILPNRDTVKVHVLREMEACAADFGPMFKSEIAAFKEENSTKPHTERLEEERKIATNSGKQQG